VLYLLYLAIFICCCCYLHHSYAIKPNKTLSNATLKKNLQNNHSKIIQTDQKKTPKFLAKSAWEHYSGIRAQILPACGDWCMPKFRGIYMGRRRRQDEEPEAEMGESGDDK
jgi:hypothetical protein